MSELLCAGFDDDVSAAAIHERLIYCSFCGRHQYKYTKSIECASAVICNICVDECNFILAEECDMDGIEIKRKGIADRLGMLESVLVDIVGMAGSGNDAAESLSRIQRTALGALADLGT